MGEADVGAARQAVTVDCSVWKVNSITGNINEFDGDLTTLLSGWFVHGWRIGDRYLICDFCDLFCLPDAHEFLQVSVGAIVIHGSFWPLTPGHGLTPILAS